MAGEDIGRAEIEVHADTSPFPGEAKRGVQRGLDDLDPDFKKAGEDWGDEASKSLGERFKSRVPEIVRKVTDEFKRQKITEHVNIETDYDRDTVKNTVKKIARDVENDLAGSGIGGKLTSLIGDAVGAGFNVSGRSPLIAILIPVFGAIAALITAAIEAVYGLGAALLTIPNLIGAIIIQAGVLYLAFQGIGDVLGKVLAAQDLNELNKAIQGVNPYLANFALEIAYIRDAFKDIGKYVSIAFFKSLGNVLLDIFDFNRYTLFHGLVDVATHLGTYFATIGKAFETPQFAKFLADLFKQINRFLDTNGPALEKFLTQVFGFLDSLMGATGAVGDLFSDWLRVFGNFLEETSKSKDFQDFLAKMPDILRESGTLIASLLDLVFALLNSVDKAGGKNFIEQLTGLVVILTAFLSSDLGIQGLQFLMITILILTAAFVDLVIIVTGFFGLIEDLGSWLLNTAWPAIRDFFSNLGHAIADGLSPKTFLNLLDKISTAFLDFISKAPGWGAKLIQGFIDGIQTKLGPLGSVLAFIGKQVSDHLQTHSPAKVGPLSKGGGPEGWGANLVEGFAKGIMSGGDQVNTAVNSVANDINFGPGAVIANFNGSTPTPGQAQGVGRALGNGIIDQLAARNARLAVRTM